MSNEATLTAAPQRAYPQSLRPLNFRNWQTIWLRNFMVWRKLAIPSLAGNLADPMIYLFGLGLGLGLLVAFNIDVIVPALERALGVAFLPGSIYLISRMPSQPLASDIVPIALISLALAFAATLYPSWRASRVNPAEALRYE